ncbi:MAG: hypothetical protein CSA26_06970 [Desulfobacterales bacterium]|nr:MAG: hypothetical protein CSA26_06970 [Desulfobacterales bacterium]
MIANRLFRWSRKLHKWVGLYVAVLAVIWSVEMIVLPPIFNQGLPTINKAPSGSVVDTAAPTISLEQALKIFIEQQPQGIISLAELDEMTYLPQKGLYRFAITERFLEWYQDARTGGIVQYGFDTNRFVTEKGMLGWAHPVVARAVRVIPFDFLFIFLTVTGCWLVFYPSWNRKKRKKIKKEQ